MIVLVNLWPNVVHPTLAKKAILQIMPIGLYSRFAREKVLCTWDSAATVSLISHSQDFVNFQRNRIFPDAFSLDAAFSGTA